MAEHRTRSEVEREIKDTLGMIPVMFRSIPDKFLDEEWRLFRDLELGETLIPNKYKELIMLGVHAETRCRYCTLFHTEAARMFGATDGEIEEAVHLAKYTVGWSAYLNGLQTDYNEFAREVEQIGEYMTSQASKSAQASR